MAISRKLQEAALKDLFLDPQNPRLGRKNIARNLTQEQILELMRGWTLEELAVSFMDDGFWTQEALVVVKEPCDGKDDALVVVEGNRRVAALILLHDAREGHPCSRKWDDIAASKQPPSDLFTAIPYLVADSRQDVEAYLGFRHVTGIKQWKPAEKARYIARMIDESGLSYKETMRKIGSRTEAVRRNYVAYRILLQMEEVDESISLEHVEEKFSVLFLSLRERGVQRFLGINIMAEPSAARTPVPREKLDALVCFARWLFGTEEKLPLFTDSRNVGRFARVLASSEAVQYLKETENPNFELAIRKAGADEPEMVQRVRRATDEVEQVLGRAHLHLDSPDLRNAVDRFGRGAVELLKKFPTIYCSLMGGD